MWLRTAAATYANLTAKSPELTPMYPKLMPQSVPNLTQQLTPILHHILHQILCQPYADQCFFRSSPTNSKAQYERNLCCLHL